MRVPPCPLLDVCGACGEMRSDELAQEQKKLAAVSRSVGRAPDGLVSSPRALGYRARVRLKVGSDGRLAYHQPRSHHLVSVPECAIARPEINAVLSALPPLPQDLEAVDLRSDGERVVWLGETPRKAMPELTRQIEALELHKVPGLSGAVLGGKVLFGEPRSRMNAGGVEHQVSPTVFTQVNLEVNALLVEAVRAEVQKLGPGAVLDLYAGYGNLSLPLAVAGHPLILMEADSAAVADAKRTAARLGLSIDARVGDAGRFRAGDAFFDVVILDPPREGAPDLMRQLVVTRPRAIVYVSCNPSAMARDLKAALSAGYVWSRLTIFDMFPQTAHTETLAVLYRPDVRP